MDSGTHDDEQQPNQPRSISTDEIRTAAEQRERDGVELTPPDFGEVARKVVDGAL